MARILRLYRLRGLRLPELREAPAGRNQMLFRPAVAPSDCRLVAAAVVYRHLGFVKAHGPV